MSSILIRSLLFWPCGKAKFNDYTLEWKILPHAAYKIEMTTFGNHWFWPMHYSLFCEIFYEAFDVQNFIDNLLCTTAEIERSNICKIDSWLLIKGFEPAREQDEIGKLMMWKYRCILIDWLKEFTWPERGKGNVLAFFFFQILDFSQEWRRKRNSLLSELKYNLLYTKICLVRHTTLPTAL